MVQCYHVETQHRLLGSRYQPHQEAIQTTYTATRETTLSLYTDSKRLVQCQQTIRPHTMLLNRMILSPHNHAQYMYRQQDELIQWGRIASTTCRSMINTYWSDTQQIHQTPYLIRKQRREEWDPTLWEIPHQPLAKCQKAHWGLCLWEIQLN